MHTNLRLTPRKMQMSKRFIWFEEAIEFPDKPHYHIVGIEGRVENNKLGVFVMMFGGGDVEVEYYGKILDNKFDDLNADTLQEQFMGKVVKVRQSMGNSWLNWLQDFQKRLRQQTGKKVYYDFQQQGWFETPSEPPSAPAPVVQSEDRSGS